MDHMTVLNKSKNLNFFLCNKQYDFQVVDEFLTVNH
jgi:hypothetical protein